MDRRCPSPNSRSNRFVVRIRFRWVSGNRSAVRGADGKVQFCEGTVEDITGRYEEQEILRAKAEFLEEVVTNATVGILVIDEDNKYVLINPECGKIVGHTPDDWTGREAGLHDRRVFDPKMAR